ncbi:protein of unknown function [Taphrina deformans PYCC 5710]|uniref:Sas10 C-terminal domain-containing protein n=1 Tax=Taphrina deformans (strain PYCC 5710 / ATCC 11124 / CBS 356.35 / IMI 108563 / JCM 9778 / NBRC 8474) TaxID=1097556 RepID=R4XML5_TAPDE|nr:protein of unknown function [Taphrina deformans PYCC 5710]|eukprot:CCG84550.1 protein of unknown function [Taphrina deformans PYCC 5710]
MGNRKKIKKTVQHEKTFDGGGANVKTIRSHKDVDSEDDFEATQDKILLEGQQRDHRATAGDMEASDEEVMALPDEDSDEDDQEYGSDSVVEDDEEEPEEGWGASKKEYYDNDDVSDEEDQKAEEQEALRIQRKNLAKLDASAYVDDFDEWKDDAEDESSKVTEVLPSTISKDLPKSELLKILHTRNPEFSPFALEFTTLIGQLDHLEALTMRKHHPQHSLIEAKMKALRSYLAVLAFYFALMSSEQAKTINIKEHEIMISLVRCRQAWQMLEPVEIDETLFEATEAPTVAAETSIVPTSKPRKRKRSSKSTDLQVPAPAAESYAPDQDDELEETFRALKSIPKRRKTAPLPDLADNVADTIDAEDSAARRKTLQFYASRINNKSSRRSAAQQGGDTDIPYRERRKERELRLQAEAERRKGGTAGADLDDEETGPREEREVGSDDEYYALVAAAAKAQKVVRKQDHDGAVAAVRAERAGYALPEQVDGKRKIGRDIAANKGLTVNRPKENRNARVKKRNKYEAAKKKLGSQKAIFKQPTGSYGGEASGINARVIKSTKMDQGTRKKR